MGGGEHPVEVRLRDADPGIGDGEEEVAVFGAGPGRDADFAGGGGEGDRVGDEVPQRLLQAAAVGAQGREGGRDVGVQADLGGGGGGVRLREDGVDEVADVDAVVGQVEPAGLEPGDVEDGIDQGLQPVGGAARAASAASIAGAATPICDARR